MATINKMNPVQTLLNSGADAYKNIWYATVKPKIKEESGYKILDPILTSVRLDSFKVPEFSIETTERQLWGKKIKVPKPEVTMDRKLTLNVRMDSEYGIYDEFKKLLHQTVNGQNNSDNKTIGVSNSIPTDKVNVEIFGQTGSYSAESGISKDATNTMFTSPTWTFEDCWVQSVAEPQFSRDSAEVVTFEVVLIFGTVDYGDK